MRLNILLVLVVIVTFFLRAFQVVNNPPSLSWDEVSIGYNAYSILKTGRDEHGKILPLDAFAAYGDYKPPIPIYLTVPFVALFGLNELAVRLPAVIFGTLTVLLTYFLVKELFKKSLLTSHFLLLTSFLLAISPWHINLSRAGFEATIALFFVVLGAYLVLKARTIPKLWIVAWLPYVASMYTFNSARYFSVIFGLGLIVFSFQEIRRNIKRFTIGVILSLILLTPLLPHLFSKESRLRFTEVNIFTDSSVVNTANERIEREGGSILAKIVNNRRVGFARSYMIHFLDTFEPWFLFVKGDGNPKFSVQDVGQLYLIEAPFLVIGILALFLTDPRIAGLLLFWIIAAIIPAATARETPHALRLLNSLPVWQIFVAYGIYFSMSKAKSQKSIVLVNASCLLLIVLYLLSFAYYLHSYYRHYPNEFSAEWQYGYKQALEGIGPIQSKYDRIVITESIGRPYMYTLFYTKTDPHELFRTKDASFDAAGFYHVYGFSKYRFGGALPDTIPDKTLYVWDALPQGVTLLKTIHLLNGNPVLYIFE